ncbi:MAG: hypothetical protein ABR928_15305, partial [Terracidiphilus sp.]
MKRMISSCLLMLGSSIYAGGAGVSTFKSEYSAQDVVLDTDTQSAFWRGASSVYAESDNWGHLVSAYRTKVSSRWTTNNLYLLYECPYEEL